MQSDTRQPGDGTGRSGGEQSDRAAGNGALRRRRTASLPDEIRRALASVRWRIRIYVWIHGLSLAVAWVILTFWAGLALDYFPVLAGASEMPREVRAGLLVLVGVVLAYILYRWVLRRAFVRMADRSMAVILERRFAQFGDSLLTAVELDPESGSSAQREMVQRTRDRALAEMADLPVHRVFDYRVLRRSLLASLALVLTLGAFGTMNSSALELSVRRMYLLDDVPWPRHARIEVAGVESSLHASTDEQATEGQLVPFRTRAVKVARGSDVTLWVRADGAAEVVPEVCKVDYTTAEGDRGRVPMTRIGRIRDGYQRYQYSGRPFKGILNDVRFDVIGYDARVRDYRIEVVPSPEVVSVELDCVFPGYMVDEARSLWMPRTIPFTTGVELPVGTSITLRGASNKTLRAVDVLDTETGETERLDMSSAPSSEFSYEIEHLGDRLSLEVTLIDTDNVRSDRIQRFYVAGVEDLPPVIQLRLDGVGVAVTPDVLLRLRGRVSDDYGIQRSWTELDVNGEDVRERPTELAAAGAIVTEIDFQRQRSLDDGLRLAPGDKLNLSVKATDFCDLSRATQVGVSERFQLEVVTPEQLLVMLESRELGLRQRFEQIIGEQRQARDTLVRLKSEGPAGVDLSEESALRGADGVQAAGADGEPPSREALLRAARKRIWSLRLLRAQRATLQCQKSAQETLGVAASFYDIRNELINNRVDSEDRKQRLKEQIADPLQQIGDERFPRYETRLAELSSLIGDVDTRAATEGEDPEVVTAADRAIEEANQILLAMEQVREQMLELQDFNELLDRFRSLIREQEELVEQTKKQQKKQVLDLFDSP